MGGSSSKAAPVVREESERIKEEHNRRMEEESEKRIEQEEKEKKDIQKKIAERLAEEKKRIDLELNEERKKRMEDVQKKVLDFKKMRSELELKAVELEGKIKENIEKKIEEIKQGGVEDVTREKNALNEDKEKLTQRKEFIVNENNRLAEARDQIRSEISEMVKQEKEEEKEKLKEHHEKMIELNEGKNAAVIKGENEKERLAENHRSFQNKMKHQHEQLHAVQVEHAFKLLSIHHEDQKSEDFRQKCKQLISSFSAFKRNFDQEESAINTSRDDIEDGIALSYPPDLSDVIRSRQDLAEEMENFGLDGAKDQKYFSSLRENVKKIVENLGTVINQIDSRINRYETSFSSSSSQLNRHISPSSTCSDLVHLDDSASLADSSVSPTKEKKGTSSENKFSIVGKYNEAKDLISKLDDQMLNFNINSSSTFETTLVQQFNRLSTSHSEIISQITNGPSTSSTPQISSGNTSESSSRPIIQQIEEPNNEKPDDSDAESESKND